MKIASTIRWISCLSILIGLYACHKSFETPPLQDTTSIDEEVRATLRSQNDGIPKGIKYFDKDYKGNDPNKLCRDWGGNCLETVIVYGRPTNPVMNALDSLLSTINSQGDITSFILLHEDVFSKYLYPPYLDSADLGIYSIKNHLLYTDGLISINFFDQNDSLIIAYPFTDG